MAIEFARLRYVKRSDGGNACRSAAYNSRADVKCQRTNERFYFAHREPSLHHTVLLPEGAHEKFRDITVLWNEAQAMEKRKDSQEAKEVLLAMPTDSGLNLEDWVKMAEEFAHEQFVSKGVAVQLDIHTPHKGEVNVHAHLLITTRRIEGDHFAKAKARDLDPEIRTMKGGKTAVTEAERWGVLWRDYQNSYFEREGLDIRVDDVGSYAQKHEGPVRMRTNPAAADARAENTQIANEAAARDPAKVLEALTRNRSTFTEMDIERHIKKYIPTPAERAKVRLAVLNREEVVALHDRESGSFEGLYTTQEVRFQERTVVAYADAIQTERKAVNGNRAEKIAKETGLDGEQLTAYLKATGTDGLVIIEGLAGTGKSHALNSIRQAHETSGWTVVGLAPTNAAADELRRAGYKRASTVHLELYYQNAQKYERSPSWNRKTVVILDEAAMLDTKTYARLMSHAAVTGAKVILAGDDRQHASVERGGMFTVMKEKFGSVIISKVRRQEQDWQRTASEDFSSGRFAEGLRAYAERGHVHWSASITESRIRLISDWDQDSREDPGTNRFVYAGTNDEVNKLNKDLRNIRVRRGEIKNELETDTVKGKMTFGSGDRIQFHGNNSRIGVQNGALGTIEEINETKVKVRTDVGKIVEWDADKFKDFSLGYAGTLYRGQGKTQTDVYALYDSKAAWNARSGYVGLTRHRDNVELYVPRDLASDELALGRQMSRKFNEAASLEWATRDEAKEIAKNYVEKVKVTIQDNVKQPPVYRFDRDELDAMRKIDLPAYARDVHGYQVSPDSAASNRFILEKTNAEGVVKETLNARRNLDGMWSFRDPADNYRKGDIFNLAMKGGASSFAMARNDVSDYVRANPAPEPANVSEKEQEKSKGTRSQFDELRRAEKPKESKEKTKDNERQIDETQETFRKEKERDDDRER